MWKKMYICMFNESTDALRLLEKGNIWEAKKILMEAQCDAEEIYMSAEDDSEDNEDEVRILPPPETEETDKK